MIIVVSVVIIIMMMIIVIIKAACQTKSDEWNLRDSLRSEEYKLQ